jgi:hypothetical protein
METLDNQQPSEATDETDYADQLLILDKQSQLRTYTPNAAQADFLANRTGRDLVLKARQLGFSTAIQADHFLSAITRTTMAVTLAHDIPTTQKLRRMAKRFYDHLPSAPPRGLDNATTTTYPQTGSEVTIATAGSLTVGRGGTYSHIHGSEVAFWKDAESLMAGILQGVPDSGQIVLESTPNGAQGWFYDRCMEALDGNSDWTLHFYAWWWDDAYRIPLEDGEALDYSDDERTLIAAHGLDAEQIQWRRKKQRELGRLFAQEYPEDPRTCFLTSGQGYFSDIADLERVFKAPTDAVYNVQHRYIAAMDFGQASDYSVVSVIDATTLQEVELWRANRIPWGDIRRRALDLCQKWQVQSLHPERNSMGGTNIEELHKEFAAAGCRTSIVPFDTTAQSKPLMVTAFHWALDQGGLTLLPDAVGKQELYGYTASQLPSGAWKYEGFPHDDTVIARMGAWHGLSAGTLQLSMTIQRWG